MIAQPSLSVNDVISRMRELSSRMAEWGATTHADGGFPSREIDALRGAGFFGINIPGAALAGGQTNTATLLQMLKLVGYGNLSVGRIFEGHINALEFIRLYANPAQREVWFAEARAGHLFGVWNTEMHDGVSVYDLSDSAAELKSPDAEGEGGGAAAGARIAGAKSFCSGSTFVSRPIITGMRYGKDGEKLGWQMLIPRLDELDLPVDESFWTPLGMQNSVSHKIDFSGCTVSADQLLGQPGDYETQPHFSGGAIRFAAVHLGGAEALLDATRSFLRKVERTGNCYQRTRVGQMAILVESGNQWLDRAGYLNDHSADTGQIVTMANMTRTAIADICTECLQLAERCVGARGLMHPGVLARLHTDLSMYLRQPAPDATLEQVGEYHLTSHVSNNQLWTCGRAPE